MELELEDQFLGSSRLPEPSQDRQGGISGNVEEGDLAQAQPLDKHCSWREPDRTHSPRFAKPPLFKSFGPGQLDLPRENRRPDIVKIYVL